MIKIKVQPMVYDEDKEEFVINLASTLANSDWLNSLRSLDNGEDPFEDDEELYRIKEK